MAPKSGKKKRKAKKIKMIGNELPDVVMHRLLKTYEKCCNASNTLTCGNIVRALKGAKEDQQIVTKFIIEPIEASNPADPIVTLDPFVQALRNERYTQITDLRVWEIPLDHIQIAGLALLLEKGFYPVKNLELMDCLIEAYSARRLALSFNLCETLTKIELDYNDFGDEGCIGVCEGLQDNRTVLTLSMCYCGLGIPSGAALGNTLATTALREVFIDGNDLECEGAIELLKACAEHAEVEHCERIEAARKKQEEAELAEQEAKENKGLKSQEALEEPVVAPVKDGKKKKKKKGKKKKSKEPPPPPPVGPWLYKLHIADNGIDTMGKGGELSHMICMRLLSKLITYSQCLLELDLEDNLIGQLGGRQVMEALEDRKEADLPGVKMRTTHRMETNTLNTIIKLGAGLKKKKKKGKKKKKK